MTFGQYIRQLRKNKGLSLDEICEKLAITKGYLSFIERGIKRPPKDEIVRRLAEALEEDATKLLYLAHQEKVPSEVHNLSEKIEKLQLLTEDLKSLLREPEIELKDYGITPKDFDLPKHTLPMLQKVSTLFKRELESEETPTPEKKLDSSKEKSKWSSMATPFTRAENINHLKEKENITQDELVDYYSKIKQRYYLRSLEREDKIREIEKAIEFLAKRLPTYPKNIQSIIDELVDLSPKDLAYILGVIKTYRTEILNKE